MRINTNMAALNAWRSMETNQNNLQKSLGRLSSGYRINTAADDAAGLAVSEKMTAQTRGITMATRNAQDASSLMQTAEGGAGNIQDMLQRMRELAVQASSDTLQDSDRAQLQQEFSALQSEIDRTAGSVTFNGRKLINGQSGDLATITGDAVSTATVDSSVGLQAAANISVTTTTLGADQIQASEGAMDSQAAPAAVSWTSTKTLTQEFTNAFGASDYLTFSQSGKSMTISLAAETGKTVATFVTDLNTAASAAGMSMRFSYQGDGVAGAGTGIAIESNQVGSAGNVTVIEKIAAVAGKTSTFGFTNGTGDKQAAANASVTIKNIDTGLALTGGGTDYTVSGNTITGVSGAGKALQGLTLTAAVANSSATVALTKNGLTFQVGANSGETISATLGNLTSTNLGVDSSTLSISDKTHATAAISTLDTALSKVSTERAKMGALQNRLDNAVSSLQTQNENITAADSRIRDVDMAAEMAQFTKYQVLSQASTAMLAQANQLSQGILTLLR